MDRVHVQIHFRDWSFSTAHPRIRGPVRLISTEQQVRFHVCPPPLNVCPPTHTHTSDLHHLSFFFAFSASSGLLGVFFLMLMEVLLPRLALKTLFLTA